MLYLKELQIAHFGSLNNVTIPLERGINLISGANEAGKRQSGKAACRLTELPPQAPSFWRLTERHTGQNADAAAPPIGLR